jgi:hypothetical protein
VASGRERVGESGPYPNCANLHRVRVQDTTMHLMSSDKRIEQGARTVEIRRINQIYTHDLSLFREKYIAMPNPKLDWFTHDRLGLFAHWGLYALGARHEWLMNRERIQTKTYERYARYFEPDLFDPVDWAQQAKRAGMKYVVLTTKHHEGFCLWDSKLTDYTVMNTPYGKDILAQYVEAVRAAGLKVGLYHSLLDWHDPQAP